MSWLSRAFTLPASRNSLSDLLGKEAAATVAHTVLAQVAKAAASALGHAAQVGEQDLAYVADVASAAVAASLGSASPNLVRQITDKIHGVVESTDEVVDANVKSLSESIAHHVGAVLGVSEPPAPPKPETQTITNDQQPAPSGQGRKGELPL